MWIGSKTRKWLAFRRRWMKHHKPNHEGYYICYLCQKWVKPNEMELDHMEARSRAEDKVFDEHNIRPACHDCNTAKGSLSVEEYLANKT